MRDKYWNGIPDCIVLVSIVQTLLLGMKGAQTTRAINTRFIQRTYKSMMKRWNWVCPTSTSMGGPPVLPACLVDSRKLGPTWHTHSILVSEMRGYRSDGKVNQQGYYCIDAVSSVQECLCLKNTHLLLLLLLLFSRGKGERGERSYIGSCHCDLLGS